MNIIFKIVYVAIIIFCAQDYAYSQTTSGMASGSSYAKLIEVSKQTFLPGIRDAQPTEKTSIIIVWKSKSKPQTFFWRGNGDWAPCSVQKVHKSRNKNPKYEFGETWYNTSDISSLSKVKRGDTLELTPEYGGKYPTPDMITDDIVNRVFFKTTKPAWFFVQAKNIIQRPNVAMP